MKALTRAAAVALGCLLPLSAFADEARQHDGGFFLRLAPGAGMASSKITFEGDDLKVSGPAGNFDLALGFVVSPNVAVHASFGAWSAVEPKIELNGEDLGDMEDVTESLITFGGGLTVYSASNMYLTATVGVARFRTEFENITYDSDSGIAFEGAVGKEWWVADRWGIGLAAVVNYHSVPDPDLDENWKGVSFGVRFSATMN